MIEGDGILWCEQYMQVAKIVLHLAILRKCGGFFVVKVLMQSVDFAGAAAGRAVLIDGKSGQPVFAHGLGDVVEQHLRAPDRKRRDDDTPVVSVGRLQNAVKSLDGFGSRNMVLVAVGGFQEEQVGPNGQNRIAQNGRASRSEIARKDHHALSVSFADRQFQTRRAQDVAGLEEARDNALGNFSGTLERMRAKAVDQLFDVVLITLAARPPTVGRGATRAARAARRLLECERNPRE